MTKEAKSKKSSKQNKKVKTNQKKQQKNFLRKILIIFLILDLALIVIFGTLLCYEQFYRGRIYAGINVAGIKVGGLTRSQAKEKLESKLKQVDEAGIPIAFQDKKAKLKFSDIDLKIDANKYIEKAYSIGRDKNLSKKIAGLFMSIIGESKVQVKISLDEKKLEEYVNKLADAKPAVNAGLKIDGIEINFTPAENGLEIDRGRFIKDLTNNINSKTSQQIELVYHTLTPVITKEEQTQVAKDQTEKIIAGPITFTYNRYKWIAKPIEIGSWLSFEEKDGQLQVKVDKEKAEGYFDKLSAKIDTQKIDKELEKGTENVLQEGRTGKELNRDALVDDIFNKTLADEREIALNVKETPFETKYVNPIAEPGRWPGKYIDINLRRQTMTIFEGDNQVGRFAVSTGKSSMPTPIGTFSILDKAGTVPCYPSPEEYNTCYMPLAMHFTSQGHAIHALPIIDGYQEGAGHLGYRVSHGCVRLSPSAAQEVWDWAEIGIPVYIHN